MTTTSKEKNKKTSMSFLQPIVKVLDSINSLNAPYFALSLEEQRALSFVERVKMYNWSFEIVVVALMLVMYAFYAIGSKGNVGRANKLFIPLSECFQDDLKFARVGFSTKDGDKKKFVSEQNNTWFTTFATGRSAIESITARSHMYARYNPLAMLMERLLATFIPSLVDRDLEEFVQITIKPNGVHVTSESAMAPGNAEETLNKLKFITSIVNKTSMNKCRNDNYFLSLTHTAESDKLPLQYVFMSENNQLNGFIPHYANANFNELLVQCSDFLQFISFTDLPDEKPITDKLWQSTQMPRCVIQCKLSTNGKNVELLKKLIASLVEIYDEVTKELVNNSPSTFITTDLLKKSTNLRNQELNKIIKVMKQVEREMALEKKQEQEKLKRRELRDKLSGEEQDKLDKKMKEKRERRLRNKQKLRM